MRAVRAVYGAAACALRDREDVLTPLAEVERANLALKAWQRVRIELEGIHTGSYLPWYLTRRAMSELDLRAAPATQRQDVGAQVLAQWGRVISEASCERARTRRREEGAELPRRRRATCYTRTSRGAAQRKAS
jgi:hypothetical protein